MTTILDDEVRNLIGDILRACEVLDGKLSNDELVGERYVARKCGVCYKFRIARGEVVLVESDVNVPSCVSSAV